MKRGAVFVDENDYGISARLLFYIEDSVQDGIILKDGSRRTISKHVHFVEMDEGGKAVNAGYAPYLDYRATDEAETAAVLEWAGVARNGHGFLELTPEYLHALR